MGRRYRNRRNDSIIILLIRDVLFVLADILYYLVWGIYVLITEILPEVVYNIWAVWGYRQSDYYLMTHKPLHKVIFDKGAYGEYLIYRHLKKLEGPKKWLFNTYLPRDDGKTTEVDVILLRQSGIYVFESKNYSGWIFGTENRKVWTQCLKPSENARTRKFHFLNPIMQNKLHIQWLKKQFPENEDLPIRSIILFGDRCRLKNIVLTTNEHRVVTRGNLFRMMLSTEKDTSILSEDQIEQIYRKLYPMTQVDDSVKIRHIQDIQDELSAAAKQPFETSDGARHENEETPGSHEATDDVPGGTAATTEKQAGICPVCGGNLVLRTTKHGERAGEQFYGCSNFPKCKYTKNFASQTKTEIK